MLMADMPTLAHYFEEYGPNSWRIKLEYWIRNYWQSPDTNDSLLFKPQAAHLAVQRDIDRNNQSKHFGCALGHPHKK